MTSTERCNTAALDGLIAAWTHDRAVAEYGPAGEGQIHTGHVVVSVAVESTADGQMEPVIYLHEAEGQNPLNTATLLHQAYLNLTRHIHFAAD